MIHSLARSPCDKSRQQGTKRPIGRHSVPERRLPLTPLHAQARDALALAAAGRRCGWARAREIRGHRVEIGVAHLGLTEERHDRRPTPNEETNRGWREVRSIVEHARHLATVFRLKRRGPREAVAPAMTRGAPGTGTRRVPFPRSSVAAARRRSRARRRARPPAVPSGCALMRVPSADASARSRTGRPRGCRSDRASP